MGFFAVQFMASKKGRHIKSIILVFLPLYFIFLHHSMQNYHSHFFSGGIVITHTHSFDNNDTNSQDNNKEQSENQIIVFHGFSLDLGDNVEVSVFEEYSTSQFTKISPPVILVKCSDTHRKKTGRAPPAFYL